MRLLLVYRNSETKFLYYFSAALMSGRDFYLLKSIIIYDIIE